MNATRTKAACDASTQAPFCWDAWNADMDRRRGETLRSLAALDIAEAQASATAIAIARQFGAAVASLGERA